MGLNSPTKRSLLKREFKCSKCIIMLIQETHYRKPREFLLKALSTGMSYFASFTATVRRQVWALFSQKSWVFALRGLKDTRKADLFSLRGGFGIVWSLWPRSMPQTLHKFPFRWTSFRLSSFGEGSLIVGGDFNLVRHAGLDKLSSPDAIARSCSGPSECFLSLLSDMGLSLGGSSTLTTGLTPFPLPTELSPGFIPFLFFTPSSRLQASSILPIAWSGHDLVCTDLDSPPIHVFDKVWRCNDALLNEPVLCDTIRAVIDEYFSLIETDDVSASTIWEVAKATIRGEFISLSTSLNRVRKEEEVKLLSRIRTLEVEISELAMPCQELEERLALAKLELKALQTVAV